MRAKPCLVLLLQHLFFHVLCTTSGNRHGEGCAADGGSCASEVTSPGVVAEALVQDGAVSMLQHRGKRRSEGRGVNLAVDGGGAASVALFSALIAALTHDLGTRKGVLPNQTTLENTQLLQSVANISTVSGGSWLMAGLAYSPYFLQTVELMAQDPGGAGGIWNSRWTKPLLEVPAAFAVKDLRLVLENCFLGMVVPGNSVGDALVLGFKEVMEGSLGARLSRTLLEHLALFSYHWAGRTATGEDATEFSWQEVVDGYMARTTLISPEAAVGSTPNAWAAGKAWVPVVSQLEPAPSNSDYDYVRSLLYEPVRAYAVTHGGERAGELVCPWWSLGLCRLVGRAAPTFMQILFGSHLLTPAKFTTTLSNGHDTGAPAPWCNGVSCTDKRARYEARSWGWPSLMHASKRDGLFQQTTARKQMAEVGGRAFDVDAGRLPVLGVAAASSATGGLLELFALYGRTSVCSRTLKSLTVPDTQYQTFEEGSNFMLHEANRLASINHFSPDAFAQAVKLIYQRINDGGLLDSTGVMALLSEGAQEVVSIFPISSMFVEMFRPPQGQKTLPSYNIFEETQQKATAHLTNRGKRLQLPPGSKFRYLQGIRYGSFVATTSDSKGAREFAIAPGREVVLDWVFMDAGMELLEPLTGTAGNASSALAESYNTLVQEVMDAILYVPNRPHLAELQQMLGAI